LARFTEDGSRKITRVTECAGLDENNQYRTCDLFVSKLQGRSRDGRLIADLVPTGQKPTFYNEPREKGLEKLIRLSETVWL
jgi:pilus assembly protein CpaF